ncbi:MAG: TetR family transcriptional regulator [Trichocoleus desertorum ATA4-8-CV12]|nr:TetR family transcriptional regulator [Trichocoleus desertorum ATA4-8-CV12]
MAQSSKVGRPSRGDRNPDTVKTEILNAAMEEFARHGLEAASTRMIAVQAGVTKAMIHYYFKTKEGLYRAVLENVFNGLLTLVEQGDFLEMPPADALEQFVRQVLLVESAHPHLHRMLFQETIQNQSKYYKEMDVGRLVYGTLSRILDRGISTGIFRPLNPQHTAVNIMGVCTFYFGAQDSLQHLFQDQPLLSPAMLEQHTQEAIALIMAGVLQHSTAN